MPQTEPRPDANPQLAASPGTAARLPQPGIASPQPGAHLPRPARRAVLAAATAGGAALLAGCTGSASGAGSAGGPLAGLTANQIAARALHDLTSASSVHFAVSGKAAGVKLSDSLTVTRKGCEGAVSISMFGTFRFIELGKTSWTLLTKQYLKQFGYTPAQINAYAGKWLKDDKLTGSDTSALCSPRQFSQGFPKTGWSLGRVTTLSGHRVVAIANKKQKVTAYVLVSSRPEFVKLTGGGATATFSAYNARVKISPPPAKLVVNSLPTPPGL